MSDLTIAVRTIHADRDWWWKLLIGGALWLSIVGWPAVEGFQVESLDNSSRGFPGPLPRWDRLGDKTVTGVFALLIDFFYFVFPVLLGGMVFFCGALFTSLSGNSQATFVIAVLALGGAATYTLAAWLSGASPVGKQRYVLEGELEKALSSRLIGELIRPPSRHVYLQARLRSVPVYLLALGLICLAVWLASVSGPFALVVGWLALSTLLYARLVTIQLYLASTRAVQRRRFDLLYNRSET